MCVSATVQFQAFACRNCEVAVNVPLGVNDNGLPSLFAADDGRIVKGRHRKTGVKA
jgi:hypothetical protein